MPNDPVKTTVSALSPLQIGSGNDNQTLFTEQQSIQTHDLSLSLSCAENLADHAAGLTSGLTDLAVNIQTSVMSTQPSALPHSLQRNGQLTNALSEMPLPTTNIKELLSQDHQTHSTMVVQPEQAAASLSLPTEAAEPEKIPTQNTVYLGDSSLQQHFALNDIAQTIHSTQIPQWTAEASATAEKQLVVSQDVQLLPDPNGVALAQNHRDDFTDHLKLNDLPDIQTPAVETAILKFTDSHNIDQTGKAIATSPLVAADEYQQSVVMAPLHNQTRMLSAGGLANHITAINNELSVLSARTPSGRQISPLVNNKMQWASAESLPTNSEVATTVSGVASNLADQTLPQLTGMTLPSLSIGQGDGLLRQQAALHSIQSADHISTLATISSDAVTINDALLADSNGSNIMAIQSATELSTHQTHLTPSQDIPSALAQTHALNMPTALHIPTSALSVATEISSEVHKQDLPVESHLLSQTHCVLESENSENGAEISLDGLYPPEQTQNQVTATVIVDSSEFSADTPQLSITVPLMTETDLAEHMVMPNGQSVLSEQLLVNATTQIQSELTYPQISDQEQSVLPQEDRPQYTLNHTVSSLSTLLSIDSNFPASCQEKQPDNIQEPLNTTLSVSLDKSPTQLDQEHNQQLSQLTTPDQMAAMQVVDAQIHQAEHQQENVHVNDKIETATLNDQPVVEPEPDQLFDEQLTDIQPLIAQQPISDSDIISEMNCKPLSAQQIIPDSHLEIKQKYAGTSLSLALSNKCLSVFRIGKHIIGQSVGIASGYCATDILHHDMDSKKYRCEVLLDSAQSRVAMIRYSLASSSKVLY